MGSNAAARTFGIPKTTLKDRISGKVKHGTKPGPVPYLTEAEEKEHVNFLTQSAAVGCGKTKVELFGILDDGERKTEKKKRKKLKRERRKSARRNGAVPLVSTLFYFSSLSLRRISNSSFFCLSNCNSRSLASLPLSGTSVTKVFVTRSKTRKP